jgi:hypothetical protein
MLQDRIKFWLNESNHIEPDPVPEWIQISPKIIESRSRWKVDSGDKTEQERINTNQEFAHKIVLVFGSLLESIWYLNKFKIGGVQWHRNATISLYYIVVQNGVNSTPSQAHPFEDNARSSSLNNLSFISFGLTEYFIPVHISQNFFILMRQLRPAATLERTAYCRPQ